MQHFRNFLAGHKNGGAVTPPEIVKAKQVNIHSTERLLLNPKLKQNYAIK